MDRVGYAVGVGVRVEWRSVSHYHGQIVKSLSGTLVSYCHGQNAVLAGMS